MKYDVLSKTIDNTRIGAYWHVLFLFFIYSS